METLALDALGAGVAGFVQGLSGFAFGLVAMSFWAWSLTPQVAGPMTVFGSVLGQTLSLQVLRRGFAWRRAAPFLAGGMLGVPIGVALLSHINPLLFKAAVGSLLVLWCPAMLFADLMPRVAAGGAWADGAAGLVGGVMGGLAGLTGPAPALWCMLRGWEKDEQRSIFQSFNLLMNALTLAVYLASGLITVETLRLFAVVALAMLVPTFLGTWLYSRLDNAAFRRLVLIVLFLSGIVLLGSIVAHTTAR